MLVAVHREGTLTRAAATLGVDQTTVSRRLAALEASAGVQLFEQLRGGVQFTPAGERMVETALEIEASVLELERDLLGRTGDVRGTVRITTPVMYAAMLMPELKALAEHLPLVDIEIAADNSLRNITRREADVAIRVTRAPAEHLVGRRICPSGGGIYATSELLERFPEPADRPWIGALGAAPTSMNEQARSAIGPDVPVGLRVDHGMAHVAAVVQGAGVSILPCGIERVFPSLVRTGPVTIWGDVWVLTHRETLRAPRIRAVMDFLYDALQGLRGLLSGEAASAQG
jgi:DNA-binding transcriptional LysR family regulator